MSSTVSDGSGVMKVSSEAATGPMEVHFSGDSIISRQTFLRIPGSDVVVSVIPTDFDLVAFDEMARQPAIKRWTSKPSLVIERRILTFDDLAASTWTATGTLRDDASVTELESDLRSALRDLTGDTLTTFTSVNYTSAPADLEVEVSISNQITVFWVEGLAAGSGFDGFSRWEYRDWVITGGVILLDADADRRANRRWLRYHELGHTLGFTHVTTRPSLMAPSAQPITAFDRTAGRLVYLREPGNRSPDIDPADASLNSLGPTRWSAWVGSDPARGR
jgi:hypothetical protein